MRRKTATSRATTEGSFIHRKWAFIFAGVAGGDGGVLCVPSASALFSITEEELSIIGGLVTGGEAG